MRFLTPMSLAAVIIGLGCSDATAPTIDGEWGGPEATLVLADTGGTVQYQCGFGTIDSGWNLGNGGRWTATGLYFPGGGPGTIGGPPPHPATYTGTRWGNVLTFTVTVPDVSTVIGPLKVKRGAPGATEVCA